MVSGHIPISTLLQPHPHLWWLEHLWAKQFTPMLSWWPRPTMVFGEWRERRQKLVCIEDIVRRWWCNWVVFSWRDQNHHHWAWWQRWTQSGLWRSDSGHEVQWRNYLNWLDWGRDEDILMEDWTKLTEDQEHCWRSGSCWAQGSQIYTNWSSGIENIEFESLLFTLSRSLDLWAMAKNTKLQRIMNFMRELMRRETPKFSSWDGCKYLQTRRVDKERSINAQ